MIHFLLNINHSVTLFRHCIGFVHVVKQSWKILSFLINNQSLSKLSFFFFFWQQFLRLWSQPDYWCFCAVRFCIFQVSDMYDVCVSVHLYAYLGIVVFYVHENACRWFFFFCSENQFRQASEPELLQNCCRNIFPCESLSIHGSDMGSMYDCVPYSMSTLAIFIKDSSETVIISASTFGWNPNAEH